MKKETIGMRMVRMRKLRGFSQTELSKLIGVTQQRVQQLEVAANDNVRLVLARKIAKGLGITLCALVEE